MGCLPVLGVWILALVLVWTVGDSWGSPVSVLLMVAGVVAGLAVTLKWLVDNSPGQGERPKHARLPPEDGRKTRRDADDHQ